MNRAGLAWLAGIVLLCATLGGARAEDIDLYAANNGNTGSVPNILLVIDNAADFDSSLGQPCTYQDDGTAPTLNNKVAGIIQCSLYNAVLSLPVNSVNMGLMFYSGPVIPGCVGNQGGCLAQPLQLLTPAYKASFLAWIRQWVTSGNTQYNVKANGETTGAAIQEAWAYYAGKVGISGRDYSGIQPAPGCQKNYVVYVANSLANNTSPNDNGSGSAHAALIAAPGVTASQLVPITDITQPNDVHCTINGSYANALSNHSDTSGLWADEWTRYMYQTDLYGTWDGTQSISTYTIGILGPNCNALFPTLLKSMADQGGGTYYSAYTSQDLYKAFEAIFNELQAINSVFASATLPVSVNLQGYYLNQVYIGMFRPDQQDKPRWLGNLKQYQFGVDVSTPSAPKLFLADQNGKRAIASDTGFITPNAVSIWTSLDKSALPDSLGTNGGFWINNQQGAGLGFDSPDGQLVEKGAVSQQIRLKNLVNDYSQSAGSDANPRKLYTCTSGSGWCNGGNALSDTPFAVSNSDIGDAQLGTGTGSIGISSFSRSGTTMTVTLNGTPSLALTVGQTVNIIGASTPALNGAQTITAVPTTTSFRYTIAEAPPTPSTGTFRAYKGTSNPKTISALTRSGTLATATVTAHGYSTGQSINISGADPTTSSAYNGNFTITVLNANQFTYTIADSPVSPGNGGTATEKGFNTTASIGSLVRTSSTGTTTAVTATVASGTLGSKFVVGSTITISGTNPSNFNLPNGLNATTTITGLSTACPSGTKNKSFCFTINTYPAATAVAASGQTLTADTSITYPVTFTHTATTCPGANGNIVTVTGTAPGHNFANGNSINITGSPGPNETAYLGSFTVSSVTTNTFAIANFATTPTCTPSASGASVLISPDTIDRTTLINWVRGEDSVGDELTPKTSGINVRGSVHGDVLHSRPAIVNYGDGRIVAYYGSNDGVFRAVNANLTGNIGTTPPGGEMWGFIPREFFSGFARQYLNSPNVKLFTTPAGVTPAPKQKPYFFDGDVGVYQSPTNDKVYIYLSARRGGRLIYAIDVTDPSAPKYLWKKGCPNLDNNTGCDTGFDELGQTWSRPKAAFVAGYSKPVVIFAAGYDPYQDQEPPGAGGSAVADRMGRGIFVLDAIDGTIVWKAGPGGSTDRCTGTNCTLASMTYSIPSDVTLIDRNYDGKIDRMYVADTGGNIWRVDLEPAAGNQPSNWMVNKLAALGGASTDSVRRKFLYSPDVVATKDFDVVLAVTGDREHPLKLNTSTFNVVNRFYALKDPYNGIAGKASSPPTTWTAITDATSSTANTVPTGLFNCTACASGGTVYDGTGSGYYISLLSSGGSGATGEKGVNQPASIGGFTYFSTNEPKPASATSCVSNLGLARGYRIGTFTGTTEFTTFAGGGLPPSPVIGMVTINYPGLSTTTTVPFLIGGGVPNSSSSDARSPIGAQIPSIILTGKRVRTSWHTEHDK